MAAPRLRKYLAYYQKALRDDPKNVEARLRLASLFKQLGRREHAVEEYVVAAKLLAADGLPLEAIAACKAVLELDPTHTDTQMFLARLFAQVPDASGASARVARPVDEEAARQARTGGFAQPRAPGPASRRASPMTLDASARVPDGQRPLGTKLEERRPAPEARAESIDLNSDEFRGTQDIDERDILAVQPTSLDEQLRTTQSLDEEAILEEHVLEPEDVRETVRFEPVDRDEVEQAAVEPRRREDSETFEVGVFDMESLELGSAPEAWDDLSFLDELDSPPTMEMPLSAAPSSRGAPEVLSVARSQLPKIPLFSDLSPQLFAKLLQVIEIETYQAGQVVGGLERDEARLSVIVRGRGVVTRRMDDGGVVELATVEEGDFFGEFYLLTGRYSEAQVTAATEMTILEIREEVIDGLADSHPEIWDILWSFYHSRMLNNLLATSELFHSLDEGTRGALASRFRFEAIPPGELILAEGQRHSDLYLISDGTIRVEVTSERGEVEEVARMREGEFFGVISSAEESPVVASLTAEGSCGVLVLPGDVFRSVMAAYPEVAREAGELVRRRKSVMGRYASGSTDYAAIGLTSDSVE